MKTKLNDSTLVSMTLMSCLGLIACSGSSSSGNSTSTGGSANADGTTSNGGATGSTTGGNSAAASTTPNPNTGPLFANFDPPTDTQTYTNYGSNGVAIDTTYYFYVENTGGSGVATVTVSYQGYTETNQFTIDSGAQYVLASRFAFAGGLATSTNCILSVEAPGLTNSKNQGATNALLSNYGECPKVAGKSASQLIPLASCTCSGGCGQTCPTNCGFLDEQCCGGCPAGKTCSAGFCF